MRIPLIRSGGDNTPYAWWEWLFAPVMCPLFTIGIIGLGLLSGFVILTIPFQLCYGWSCKRRFTKLMKSRSRYLPWRELKPRLLAGEGTLIVEQAVMEDMRVWWTTDDVMQLAPVQPCDSIELYYDGDAEPPFVAWCYEQYLHPDTGKGLLTHPDYAHPALGFFGLNDPYTPGFVDKSFFTQRFPKMRVVMTVKPFPQK